MTPEAMKHELDQRHLEMLLCAARLREAIHEADLWCARREQRLRRFDAHLAHARSVIAA